MRLLLTLSLTILSFLSPAIAANPVEAVTDHGAGIVQRMVELSLRQEVSATDVRVTQAQSRMNAVTKATGETEQAVAAACTRAARFIFDATKAPATSLDVLDALAVKGGRRPMNETIGLYVAARRNSAGKTHAEALAGMK